MVGPVLYTFFGGGLSGTATKLLASPLRDYECRSKLDEMASMWLPAYGVPEACQNVIGWDVRMFAVSGLPETLAGVVGLTAAIGTWLYTHHQEQNGS